MRDNVNQFADVPDREASVAIVSLKFSPGMFSHMAAMYNLYVATGFKPYLVLSKRYRDYVDARHRFRVIYQDDIAAQRFESILWYNIGPLDSCAFRTMTRGGSSVVYLYYHEPWIGLTAWLSDLTSRREGVVDSARVILRKLVVGQLIVHARKVVLPSEAALSIYSLRRSLSDPVGECFPLVFEDTHRDSPVDRKYISFIGHAGKSHNFDRFLEYIFWCVRNFVPRNFLIATRSEISTATHTRLARLIDEGRVVLQSGRPLSIDEMDHAFRRSIVVWCAYARSTQSGILANSFMHGTPVIATPIGNFTNEVDGRNGFLVPVEFSPEDIDRAVIRIASNYSTFSANARRSFEERFLWTSQVQQFKKVFLDE